MTSDNIRDHLYRDVRMKGFASRSTVEEATAWVEAAVRVHNHRPAEIVELNEAFGRVLASDIVSPVDVPRFDRSMMDGYALAAAETQGATPYQQLCLRIVGSAFPGRAFQGILSKGEAIRIMTGAPIPVGADAVLPVEQSEVQAETLFVSAPVSPLKNVGQIGEDVKQGEKILPKNRVLRPQDLGILSSIGMAKVAVIRRPVVRIFVTGNELLPAGSSLKENRIADANGPILNALVRRDGGDSIPSEIIPDDEECLIHAMSKSADVILVSGGSSVGQEDHVPRILAERGELAIHGIAMRPSSPAGMGRLDQKLVFLLPGNPVSCMCAYDFFAGPAIRELGGLSKKWPYPTRKVRLTRKLVSVVGRVDYARLIIEGNSATPIAIGGASILSSTTRANGFTVIPSDLEGYAEGTEIDALMYDQI